MNTAEYNGHPTWDHWNVSLWLLNDESTYRAINDGLKWMTAEAVSRGLWELLPDNTPDGAPYTFELVSYVVDSEAEELAQMSEGVS